MPDTTDILKSTHDEANYVRRRLVEYNFSVIQIDNYEEINLCLKNDKDQVIAGLNSAIIWNWMEVDILWVDENCRGEGLGLRLLDEAERIARSRSCAFIKLNTFSFQAPEFYKKNGYEVIAVIEDAPESHKHYYLKKSLR